MQVKS